MTLESWKDQTLYDYAMRMVGKPYIWGGDDPILGFDCSGLVIELLQSCGQYPNGSDTTAQGLFNYLEKARATYISAPRFGSIVFFGSSTTKITHVSFCLDRFRMLEAGGGGSRTLDEGDAAAQNAYVRIRPVEIRSDRAAILMPFYHSIGAL